MYSSTTSRFRGLQFALPATVREGVSLIEWLRFLAEWGLLVPAGAFLPLRLALGLATGVGVVDSLLPTRTRRAIEREMRALGVAEDQVANHVRQRMVLQRQDLVWLERMGRGRESLDQWTVTESNGAAVRALIASGRSFIVAAGHFTKAATKLRFKVVPPVGASVTAAVLPWRPSPRHLRERLANQVEGRARAGLLREHRTTTVHVGHAATESRGPTLQDRLVADLVVPGTVTQVLVDAYWDRPNAHRRSFAGQAERGFSLGAARIARRAQCPIVPFVAVFGPGVRSVRIDWGDPIEPSPVDEAAADAAVIDRALDFLDAGARRYPAQYVD